MTSEYATNITFCTNCKDIMRYSVTKARKRMIFRNGKAVYDEYYAVCNECGEKVFLRWLNDINDETRKAICLRRKNGRR